VMAENQNWQLPPNKRNRQRNNRSNDFTRTLFGF